MSDVIYLLVLIGFFALAAGVVRLCESVIGPDDPSPDGTTTAANTAETDADEVVEVGANTGAVR